MADYGALTPGGTRSGRARALRIAARTGRPPMIRVGARETGLMGKVGEATQRGNDWLESLGLEYIVDEVAIMLPEAPKEAQDWYARMLDRVGQEGITYFNRSRSTVTVHSLPSVYEVEYHFFTTAVTGVRIELMDLAKGHSPLHALYNAPVRGEDARGRDACIVHASFKVEDEERYGGARAQLMGMGWVCGQECSSDYGRFGYWRHPDDEGSLLWLKPRVNLRDSAGSFTPDGKEEVGVGQEFQYPDHDAEKAELLDEEEEDDF